MIVLYCTNIFSLTFSPKAYLKATFLDKLSTNQNVSMASSRANSSEDTTGYIIKDIHNCSKVQNVAFLKTHKCGSSTTSNMLRRFSIRNNLNTVLMNTPNNYWILGNLKFVVPLPKGESFNMLDIDSFYNRKTYQKLVPNNPKYLAILRDPVERYISFEFDGSFHGGHFRRNKSNVFMFEDPFAGDPRSLHQQMSVEFGLNPNKLKNEEAIHKQLRVIDQEFDFVILLEYIDESLVLLKRLFCWQMKDIIYKYANKNMNKNYAVTPDGRKKLETELKADMIFYEHFKTKLFKTINKLGVELQQEVWQFRYVLKLVGDYCNFGTKRTEFVNIPSSDWNESFSINKKECELMSMGDVNLAKFMIKNALKKYQDSVKKSNKS